MRRDLSMEEVRNERIVSVCPLANYDFHPLLDSRTADLAQQSITQSHVNRNVLHVLSVGSLDP